MHVAGKKKAATTRKKKAVKKKIAPIEEAPALEETLTAKEAKPARKTKESSTSDKRANLKGVWEVSLDSGVLIGYFDGTPARIASYVAYFHQEGRYIRKLNFVKVNISKVPREIFKVKCCEKRFTSKDKFCSRCGKKLRFELPHRKNIKLTIAVPSFRSLEKSKW